MTIRKRFFWSNIMMLVIPTVLSIAISYMILFMFTGRSEIPMERAFPKAFDIILRFQRNMDLELLIASAEEFNDQFEDKSVFMAVLEGNELLYPEGVTLESENRNLFDMILSSGATGTITVNNMRTITERVGEYRIILVDGQYRLVDTNWSRSFSFHMLLLLVMMILMIMGTNRLLTFLLTRKIMIPLNLLADGAHQLGDGNLDYRIEYKGKDEFTPVCEDFNQMASHLQKLIVRQQRDEESRKELLAGISHDLRTPLTSIKAYVEGLLDGVAEDMATQLRYMNIIRNKAEDIDRIVDKLFLFSKLEIGEFPFYHEKLDIGEELEAMVNAAEEEHLSELKVELTENVKGVYVYADPVQLRNALVNVLENSVRYKTKECCNLAVRSFVEGNHVAIWLTDDGPGVPEEGLDKLFNVFYRGDPSRRNPSKGSGLGLSITARIMEKMGGAIRAENVPGGGLRIVLHLPRYVEGVAE